MNPKQLAKNMSERDEHSAVLTGLVRRKTENRCSCCENLLFTGELGPGTLIEAKCRRCGQFTRFGVHGGKPGG